MKIEDQLLDELDAFTAFARSRVGDPHLAADVVQDSLLKALKSIDQVRDDEQVVAWFYRILRHTIIDLYRRRDSARRATERFEYELKQGPDAEEERVICACVEALIPTLKPEYAQLIRELDLAGRDPAAFALEHGLSANHLRVRHHRARQQLRERLEATCKICATHGCLDCNCGDDA
ncbi:MAG TPA: sigma-70 family RNA polymerase sigma factor [Luteolibacter sp.]|nr:sigma-70 family RNA polymerase sigma factor [Luteolibacter sp.]